MLVCLWCVPRSVSTAFEKMMWHSGEFEVHSEPLIDHYKNSLKSGEAQETIKIDVRNIFKKLADESRTKNIFVKDMAYHLLPFLNAEIIAEGYHVFLTRDPAYSIPSLYKMRPEYTEDQPGFEGQLKLFNYIQAETKRTPLVIDAEYLCASPEHAVAQFFNYIGLPVPKNILSWPEGNLEEWKGRENWHIGAKESRTFHAHPSPPHLSDFPAKVSKSVARNRPYYEALKAFTKI